MAFPYLLAAQGGATALGALMSLLGKKNPESTTQIQNYTPAQQAWMNQSGNMAMEGLNNPYAGFDPIANQARSSFYSDTMPSIMQRFANIGNTRSSGLNAALAGAGQNLEGDLAAQRASYGLNNRNSLMQLLQLGLTPQFENIYKPESPGMMQMLGSSLMGQGLGAMGQYGMAHQENQYAKARSQRAIEAFKAMQAAQGGK